MFKNATFKLTVSYLIVVMIISIIFSAVVYRVGSNNLANGLIRETKELSVQFPVFSGTQFAQPNPADLSAGQRHLLDELILTNLVVLVGAGFISYFLARETLKPIEAAHEQQKRFTADVSHELRTPLTSLKMESEVALMDDSLTKEQLKKVIGSNIEEAAKLDTLINSLLRLTRLEAGELQQQFSNQDLRTIVKEAIDMVTPQAKTRDIKLNPSKRSLSVRGDHDSLVQMLIIFLDNAIKYSPRKSSVNIQITKSGEQTRLVITDHGNGIAAKDLEHVFDRFYRADTARSGSNGFGLGLSIAKLIADIHRADITISSQLKHGTSVTIDFP